MTRASCGLFLHPWLRSLTPAGSRQPLRSPQPTGSCQARAGLPAPLLCVLVCFFSGFAVADAAEVVRGGVATVSITPPLEWGLPLGGYGARMSKPAEGVHDLVKAKALVLARGEAKVAVVTLDIVGVPGSVKHFLVEKLRSDGFGAENVLLLPSHSHAGLEMTALNHRNTLKNTAIGIFSQRLLDFHVDRLAKVIREAAANLAPVKAGSAVGRAPGCSANRRGDKVVDDAVTVLRIDRAGNHQHIRLLHILGTMADVDARTEGFQALGHG